MCVCCKSHAFEKQFAGDKSMPPPWCPHCEEIWKEETEAMFRENDEDEDESGWLTMSDVQANELANELANVQANEANEHEAGEGEMLQEAGEAEML